MSKAYLTGTIKKLFELEDGVSAKTDKPWTRLDMVITKADGEEQILKVWDGSTLQAYEGATIEAHGKLDEYKGETRVVANAKDVTVNGNALATPEAAKTVLTGGSIAPDITNPKGQPTIPFTRLMELAAQWGPKLKDELGAEGIQTLNTCLIALTKGVKVVDEDDEEPVPF